MDKRIVLLAGALAIAGAGCGAWLLRPAPPPPLEEENTDPLPVPPVPPRIAESPEYEQCLAMLPDDPSGARTYAEAWLPRGGGEPATHCLALSQVDLGNPAEGARMLQDLAGSSHGAEAARAAIFGQANQAWLMAGDNDHAYEAASLALSLSPADPDLLIDHATDAGALGHFDEALEDATRALEIDPKRGDALVLRASAQRHLGHIAAAQDDIDRALLLDPDDVEALLERGILRQRVNDQVGARRDWERAISLEPDSTTADLAQQNLALLDAGPERK